MAALLHSLGRDDSLLCYMSGVSVDLYTVVTMKISDANKRMVRLLEKLDFPSSCPLPWSLMYKAMHCGPCHFPCAASLMPFS